MTDSEETQADRELFEELREAARDDPVEGGGPGLEEALRGRYTILGEVHRGGQGTVYRARETQTERIVALKVLPQGRGASLRERYRFEREVDLAASLDHPNIVRVQKGFSVEGHIFYAMEFIEGVTLDRFLAGREAGTGESLRLFQQVCGAVSYAHRRGVIHRDLKPQNILVGPDGEPRVLDFGLAKATWDRGVKVTMTGEFMGTLAYASPEQLGGHSSAVDIRCDVYSLGVILYEMLTGTLPYDVSGSLGDAIERIFTLPPQEAPVSSLDSDLRTIVLKALSKVPERRYESAESLSRDIGHYLADEPIEARRDSTWYIARKWLSRHRRGVGLVLGGLLVAVSVTTAVQMQGEERRQRLRSEQIGRLFTQTLRAGLPERLGGDATMPAVLEETARQLQHTLSDSPEVKAALRFTIGETYRQLLMNDEAVANLRVAVDLYTELHGPEHLDVARGLDALGQALSSRRDGEAVSCLERAVEIRRRLLGDDDATTASAKRHLALALAGRYYEPDRPRAEQLLGEVLDTMRRLFPEDHIEVALSRYRLDLLFPAQLDDQEIEARLLRDLAVFRAESESDGGSAAIMGLNSYAGFLVNRGRYTEAEERLLETAELIRKSYGVRQVPALLWRMARFELRQGDLPAAERFFRQAIARQLEGWLARSPQRSRIRALVEELSVIGTGEPPFRQAYALLIELEGVERFELAGQMYDLAELLVAQGRQPEAETLLEDSLVIHCRLFGMDCPIRATNLHGLGRLLLQREAWGEAIARLSEVRELHQRTGHRTEGASAGTALAAALFRTDEVDRAEELLLDAYGVFQNDPGADPSEVLTNLRLLGEVLASQGDEAQAAIISAQADALAASLRDGTR
jgi:tetratricopeptide (TPR) repeat protein